MSINIASAQMLEDSLHNLGQSFQQRRQQEVEAAYRNSQLDLEKQRNATDMELRQAQLQHQINMDNAANRRADAQEQRLDLANQPHIQADLKSDDGQTMTFTGTPDQLNGLLAAAKQQGKNVTVSSKRNFAAQFKLGTAQVSFEDPAAAEKFHDDYQEKTGIDLYAPQQPQKKPNVSENAAFTKEMMGTPAAVAKEVAVSDPNVSKDFNGKPTVPVSVNPADADKFQLLSGSLINAGVPGVTALPAAKGLVFGTNATLVPNLTTNTPPTTNWYGKVTPPDVSTNSFTVKPGGVSQPALQTLSEDPSAAAVLQRFGFSTNGAPSMGDTATDVNGQATGKSPANNGLQPNEVLRATKSGRMAVFDQNTRQFLRYAN